MSFHHLNTLKYNKYTAFTSLPFLYLPSCAKKLGNNHSLYIPHPTARFSLRPVLESSTSPQPTAPPPYSTGDVQWCNVLIIPIAGKLNYSCINSPAGRRKVNRTQPCPPYSWTASRKTPRTAPRTTPREIPRTFRITIPRTFHSFFS